MYKPKLWALIFTIIFLCSINLVFAHGKVSLESDACVRNANGTMVHLSTYQPQFDPEAEYCTEIPQTGDTFWVVDLIDETLRNMPVAIQIIKGNGENSEIISKFYSTNHLDGVLKGNFNLDEGAYTMRIIGEGVPPLHYEYPLRIQMINYAESFRIFLPYFLMFVFLAWTSNKVLNRKQAV
jgi:hypothetical protein